MRQCPYLCETQADVRAFVRSPSTDVDKETFVRIISEQWSVGSVDRYMTPALAAAHFDAFYELESEKMQAELAAARREGKPSVRSRPHSHALKSECTAELFADRRASFLPLSRGLQRTLKRYRSAVH